MKRILVVSGLSGAGKSTVARVLEDIGFFCIDNLPPALLNDFMVLLSSSSIDKVALVVDIRSAQLGNAVQAIKKLVDNYSNIVTVLFLEASDEELLKRFATTRRRHPLEGQLSLKEAISKEKELLGDMKEMSVVIDTTGLDIHTLREKIGSLLKEEAQFVIRIRSFGFKYGLPADTDFIIDTRFLPNPYYDRKLAQLNGTDQEIVNFFSKYPIVEDFIQYTYKLLHIAATRYKSEGRPFMTVSIGCTGGRHRSVYVAEKLSKILKDRFYVYVEHRDVNK